MRAAGLQTPNIVYLLTKAKDFFKIGDGVVAAEHVSVVMGVTAWSKKIRLF